MSVTARRYAITDPDVTARRRAVYQAGGTVSDARMDIWETFVSAEKGAGTWRLTDDYWALWGENERQGLVSLKQLRLAVPYFSPIHTPDRGYAFDGTSSYINTGFNPRSHARQLSADSVRLAVYERAEVAANTNSAGCGDGIGGGIWIRGRTAAGNLAARLVSTSTSGHAVTSSLGFLACSRTGGSSTVSGYRNGIALAASTVTPVPALPDAELYIGCRSNAGTAQDFRATSIGFVCIGAGLTAKQEAAQAANVLAWATAIGAAV